MAPKDDFADDAGGAKEKNAPPAKGKSPMLLIIIGLLVVAAAGGGTFFFIQKGAADENSEGHRPAHVPNPVMPIEALVVNISGTRMTRILRMQVHLELSEPRLADVLNEMMPRVKDRIISAAVRRTLEELEGLDGRESLKRDIALEINNLVRNRMSGSVLDVYFSEFLVQ